MGACGPGCECSTVGTVADRGALLVHSSASHTLRVLTDTARERGAEVSGAGTLRHITSTPDAAGHDEGAVGEVDSLLLALDEVLTATERDEVRAAVVLPGDLDGDRLLEMAFGAPTLGELAARVRHRDRIGLVDDLDRFHALYQPIVRLDTSAGGDAEVVGHESLLRASAPDGTEIGAADLFAAAWAGGWTNALDRVGREVAIRDAADWIGDARLFINFIPTSVYRPDVCMETTFAAARRHDLAVSQIVFEMVETHRTDSLDHLTDVVDHYRRRGASVAIDDVGSGYSSLEVVAHLRPEIVKIEQRLVRQLPSVTAGAIVHAVVRLSHEIGALVVAEGVETAEQALEARRLGCDLAQGWYFGRPVRPEPSTA